MVFWLLVKLSRDYPSRKTVHLQYEVPDGKTFASNPPTRLDVQVAGRGWELMFDYLLHPRLEVTLQLEEEQLELSQATLRKRIERAMTFNSIRILENSYDPILVSLEEGLSKKVPIVLNDSLQFVPGYIQQGPIQLKPDSVQINGPISLVKPIVKWETVPLRIEEVKSNITKQIALVSPSPELQLSTKNVHVSIQMEQVTEKVLFIPLQVRNAPDRLKYFPEKVKVTCTIGLSHYNQIDTSDFAVEIDLKRVPLSEGKHTLPIQMIKKPTEALSVQFTPKSAEFFIFKQ